MYGQCSCRLQGITTKKATAHRHTSASLTLLSCNAVGVEFLLPLEPALPVLPVATALGVAAPHPHIAATHGSCLAGLTARRCAVLQHMSALYQTECRSHLLQDVMHGSGPLPGCLCLASHMGVCLHHDLADLMMLCHRQR